MVLDSYEERLEAVSYAVASGLVYTMYSYGRCITMRSRSLHAWLFWEA